MELVSPIVYKKLQFEKFDKADSHNVECNVFYDKFSKNLVQFNDETTKIFNKSATRLIKNLNLRLAR
jgi:hypothetical protein